MEEVLMPFAVFGSAVLMVGLVTRLFSDLSLNRTLREALRAHPNSVPILAAKLGTRQPWADALIGWIFIALAAGIALTSLFESGDERREMLQASIVPLIIGLVVLAFVAKMQRDLQQHGGVAAPVPPPVPIAPRPPRAPRAPIPPTKSDR